MVALITIPFLAFSWLIDELWLGLIFICGVLFFLLLIFSLAMGLLSFVVNYGIGSRKLVDEGCNKDPLRCLGFSEEDIPGLLGSSASGAEVLLAEFDQNNRVLSSIGKIPLYSGSTINESDFMKRSRNKIELVLIDSNLVIKKKYKSFKAFLTETIALYVLNHVTNVPKLYSLNIFKLISYQSFMIGENIGSELAMNGTSVSDQYQLDVHYPGPDRWNPSILPLSVINVRNSITKETTPAFRHDLRKLISQIHENGIIINDLKYGNIIKNGDTPYLIDFDSGNYYFFKTLEFTIKKNNEDDKFEYIYPEIK